MYYYSLKSILLQIDWKKCFPYEKVKEIDVA